MLVSSRSLAEYRAMFSLTDDHLAGGILDCPGGAASFTAEVNSAGGRAVAGDPLYEFPVDELRDISAADLRRAHRYIRKNPDEYVWTFFADPDHYLASRTRSIELFAEHRAAEPESYVPACLPALPFPDNSFALALCSHLLFSYADRLDRQFHLRSILELTRVAAEVRVFPLVPVGLTSNPDLDAVRAELAAAQLSTTVHPVEYEFQRGGDHLMSIRHESGRMG